MSNHATENLSAQSDLFETESTRSLLDRLLADSRLYTRSQDYQDLLNFVVRLRNFAPFNAMLLHVQKPGLSYAASARDWRERFQRTIKAGARPLLILQPFGPVALVYDVLDTEGKALPEDVQAFFARGDITDQKLRGFEPLLKSQNIDWQWVDAGDQNAGAIYVLRHATQEQDAAYRLHINRNHEPATQFVTLVHELAHLFLGHLGRDTKLRVPQRMALSHPQQELEAESVAYIVCERNGVQSKSQTYLSHFVSRNTTVDDLALYQIMRAAGQVEALLELVAPTTFSRPGGSPPPGTLKPRFG